MNAIIVFLNMVFLTMRFAVVFAVHAIRTLPAFLLSLFIPFSFDKEWREKIVDLFAQTEMRRYNTWRTRYISKNSNFTFFSHKPKGITRIAQISHETPALESALESTKKQYHEDVRLLDEQYSTNSVILNRRADELTKQIVWLIENTKESLPSSSNRNDRIRWLEDCHIWLERRRRRIIKKKSSALCRCRSCAVSKGYI